MVSVAILTTRNLLDDLLLSATCVFRIRNACTEFLKSVYQTCLKREKMSIGVPIKLLHEAEGHIVTLETITGEVYRGKILEAEDNMNIQLQNITMTARDGRVTQLEQVFIRGSMVRFIIVPDMLKNAPMFKAKSGPKGVSSGAGRGAIQRGN